MNKIYYVVLEYYYDDFANGGVDVVEERYCASKETAMKYFEQFKVSVQENDDIPVYAKRNLDEYTKSGDSCFAICDNDTPTCWGAATWILDINIEP